MSWQNELNELWHYMLKTLIWRDKSLTTTQVSGTVAIILFSVIVNIYVAGFAFLISYYTDTFQAVVIGGISTVVMMQFNPLNLHGFNLRIMTPIYVMSSWVLGIYVISGLNFIMPLAFTMFSYFAMYIVSSDFLKRVERAC